MSTNVQVQPGGLPTVRKPILGRWTRDAVIYWGSTLVVSAVLLYSIVAFSFYDHFPPWDPHGGSAFTHLGLPSWFKFELTLAKVLALLALWLPRVPAKAREFAYFGVGLTFLSAVIAHVSVGDYRISPIFIVDPLVFFGLLVISYTYFRKRSGQR